MNPYLDQNVSLQPMNSGFVNVHHKKPNNFIDDPGYFSHYRRWLICEHKGNITRTNTTQVCIEQLDRGSKSHMFTGITMFTYIIPVKDNIQIINGRKSPAKVFSLIIKKTPKTNMIIPLWPSYYMPQKPQNKINQTVLKHYNKFISVGNEDIRWLKITVDAG